MEVVTKMKSLRFGGSAGGVLNRPRRNMSMLDAFLILFFIICNVTEKKNNLRGVINA